MAVPITIQRQEISALKRSRRLEADVPLGGEPQFTVTRQYVANGEVVGYAENPVVKRLSECPPDQTVTLANGKVLNTHEIFEGASKMIDLWDPA